MLTSDREELYIFALLAAGRKRDRMAAPVATEPPWGHSDGKNNNTFTWSGPSGVLDCTGQRSVGQEPGGADRRPPAK
jgi:hypothetical protein